MEDVLLLDRLLVAAVFLVASITKLKDPAETRETLADFGIPQSLTSPISLLLPLVELAVGLTLIPVATAWWGAMGALALLVVFTTGIGANLALGKRPDCNCFGQLHSSPIGASTLVRNGLLTALAGFVVFAGWDNPGASVVEWAAVLTGFQVIGLITGAIVLSLFAVGGWLLLILLRQQAQLLLRIEALEAKLGGSGVVSAQPASPASTDLPVGARAPTFSLADLEGKTHTLDSLLAVGKLDEPMRSRPRF